MEFNVFVSGKPYLFWQNDQPPGCSSTMKLVLYLIHELIRCEAFSLSHQEIRLASMESTGLRSHGELLMSEPHCSQCFNTGAELWVWGKPKDEQIHLKNKK